MITIAGLIPVLAGIGLIGVLMLIGLLAAGLIDPNAPRDVRLAVSFPLGAGLVTFTAFLLSWAGVGLTRLTVGLLLAVLLLGCTVGTRKRHSEARRTDERPMARAGVWSLPWWSKVVFALLILIAGALAVGRSYSAWDAMSSYSVQGYAIADSGRIDAAQSWGSGRGYPLSVPLTIALFKVMQGDLEPMSKLIFPLFYASAIVGMTSSWVRHNVPPLFAALGGLLFASAPVVFLHSLSGYVNLALACTVTLGILLLRDGAAEGNSRRQWVGGILLGLATWIRPDGLPIALAAGLGLLIAAWIGRQPRPLFQAVLAPLVLVGGAWQIYSWIVAPAGTQGAIVQFSSSVVTEAQKGRFSLDAFYWIARFATRQLLDPSAWGFLVPVGVVTILVKRKAILAAGPSSSAGLLSSSVMVAAAFVLFYYIVSFRGDLLYWLGTDVNRMLLPSVMLGWAWLVSLWSEAPPASDCAENAP